MNKHLFIIIFIICFLLVGCKEKTKENPTDWIPIHRTKTEEVTKTRGTVIVNPEHIITEIRFTLDTKNYKASTDDKTYKVKCTVDEDYTYITVTITASSDYTFSEDYKVYVNDELVDSHYEQVDQQTVKYKISDPNWSPIV